MTHIRQQVAQKSDRAAPRDKAADRLHSVAQPLIDALDEERRRISREMHDDLGNRVILLVFSIRRILNRCPESEVAHELNELLVKTIDLSGALRRLSHDVHPSTLEFAGIESTLKSLCRDFANQAGLEIETAIRSGIVPPDVALCLYRVTQECLSNIAKHSGAKSARVTITRTPRSVRLKVSDNGRGFSQAAALQNGGIGLTSMKERVRSLGGRMEIETGAGKGTLVRLTIPCSC